MVGEVVNEVVTVRCSVPKTLEEFELKPVLSGKGPVRFKVGEMVRTPFTDLLDQLECQVTLTVKGGKAMLDGFSVAGKTGTAQKVDPETGGYHASNYMSSFVGYVPAEAPELAILVVVDSPQKSTYGGVVAAPVFRP